MFQLSHLFIFYMGYKFVARIVITTVSFIYIALLLFDEDEFLAGCIILTRKAHPTHCCHHRVNSADTQPLYVRTKS